MAGRAGLSPARYGYNHLSFHVAAGDHPALQVLLLGDEVGVASWHASGADGYLQSISGDCNPFPITLERRVTVSWLACKDMHSPAGCLM